MNIHSFFRPIRFVASLAALLLGGRQLAQSQVCPIQFPTPPGNVLNSFVTAYAGYPASTVSQFVVDVVDSTEPLAPGQYLAWCVDSQTLISLPFINIPGAPLSGLLFPDCDPNLGSDQPSGHPNTVVSSTVWNEVNYILNHKNGAFWWDIQVAINNLVGGPPPNYQVYNPATGLYDSTNSDGAAVQAILNDANANAANWTPQCGNVIGVLYLTPIGFETNQEMLIEVPFPCVPCVSVTKLVACAEANGACGNFSHLAAGYTSPGSAMSPAFCYDITVTNCGSIPLTNVTVSDALLGGDLTSYFFASPSTVFPPGASLTQKFAAAFAVNTTNTVLVQGQAQLAQSITNAGGAIITNGMTVTASDQAVALVDSASISCDVSLYSSLDLDGNSSDNHVLLPSSTSSGSVTFNVMISNTGHSDLTGITLLGLSSLGCSMPSPFELAAGKSTNIQLCVQTVACPGKTFTICVTGQIGGDSTHCAVLTTTGAPLIVSSSCLGIVEYSVGVSGTVFLHCNPASSSFAGDMGLHNVLISLEDSSGNFLASTMTDSSGDYAFSNLPAGTYIIKATVGAPYVQTYPPGSSTGTATVTLAPCVPKVVNFGYADTTPPHVSVKPGTNYGCNPRVIISDTDEATNVTVTVSCGTPTIKITHKDTTDTCSGMRVFTIIVSDTFGNSSTNYVTYTWTIDTSGPMIVCPPNVVIVTNCYKVYCTFAPCDWGGPCNANSYGNGWWNSWCQNNNNNNSDCASSFNGWWQNCTGNNGGGANWWNSWNSQNCGSGWWGSWTGGSSGNWWNQWNKNNWGSQSFVPCGGSNPGSILCDNFNKVYPKGCVTIGCPTGYGLTFNSSTAVRNCFGFTANPGTLNCSAVNPTTCSAGVFCSAVLALQLNCDFGDAGCGNSQFFGSCGDLVLNDPTSPCNGKRIRDICAIANFALGGGHLPPGCTLSNLCSLVTCLNQSFQGCKVSSWCSTHLCPVCNPLPSKTGWPTITGGCSAITATNYSDVVTPLSCPGSYVITRTWTACDACGMTGSCPQTITIVQSPSSSIIGKVVSACSGDSDLSNNQALPNVSVTLTSGSAVVATDMTDNNGGYQFYNLNAGTYTVIVTPPSGYTETAPTANNSQTITVGPCQCANVPAFGYTGSTPGIQLIKCGPVCATNGQAIIYTFKVCNTGNTCLSISVNDPLLGGVIFLQSGVAPGQSLTFTSKYTINAAKGACALTNTATATGTAPNGKTATSVATAITSLTTKCFVSTICGSFNNYNPGGGSVWCNAHISSQPKQKCNVFCQNSTITFTCNNGKTYTYPVPDCKITFDPSCNTPSSHFDGTCWNTTMPCNGDDQILLSACGIPWKSDFVGCRNVCWTANFCSDCSGFNCNWQWGAACYNADLSNCGNVTPKPCHSTYCQGYNWGDYAGTPENYKSSCVWGATGGGGSGYCGNWSSSASVTCK